MPFGSTNAPATFQDMMNHIFRDMIDLGVLAYIDNLLIYTKTKEEHDTIVKEVLPRLWANRLATTPEKCAWKQKEVEFHQQKNEKLRYIAFFRSETQILNFLSRCFS